MLLMGFIYGIKFKYVSKSATNYFPTSWLRDKSVKHATSVLMNSEVIRKQPPCPVTNQVLRITPHH